MLKATALTTNLRNSITFAHHAISSRSQLPILLNFLIEARNGNIFISATDLEIGIKVKTPASVEKEGEITVSAKTFLDLISSLDQEKVIIEQKDDRLFLEAEKIKTSFPTLPAADFPRLYETKGEKQAEFSRANFTKEISKVVFAAATDVGRPALSGVLIKRVEGEKGLSLVATDGYRLSLKQGFSDGLLNKDGDISLLIPARVVRELLGLKQEQEKIEVFTSKENNQALFDCGDVLLIGRLIEAEYPSYQKIIPEDYSTNAVFDRNEAQNAVKICSVFAREAANIVKMIVEGNKIVFQASASSVGENQVEIDAKTTGEENEIAFNARYLLDLFSNTEEDQMVFEMTGPLNAGVFRAEKDKNYLHLIMPIRVTG